MAPLEFNQWLINRPTDSAGQLIADFHNYMTSSSDCVTVECYKSTYAPVAAQVPVISTEIGDLTGGGSSSCTWTSTLTQFLNWADTHMSGYYAWSWLTQGSVGNCTGPTLLNTQANGAFTSGKANPYGQGYKNYLAAAPAATPAPGARHASP
jgi:hypothetical protein